MLDPFLKWAGGKRWLPCNYSQYFPSKYKRYIEPFLGGGAIFFSLQPSDAILADVNAELINAYQAIREYPEKIERLLNTYQKMHSPDFYYRMRKRNRHNPILRASKFIYLNKTGLYRVNTNGEFNVPIGTKNNVKYEKGYLAQISFILASAKLVVSDFEPIIDNAKEGDFVYIDPPYTVMHNNNNFIKYNNPIFSWNDQIRLSQCIRHASDRGAKIMLSNAAHKSVFKLYDKFGSHLNLKRRSVLAASSSHRLLTDELLIVNY
jgi:DNA adenine methylase